MLEKEIEVLKALANGVNYFTGEKCEDDSVLNDINIVRTLYNVCDYLQNQPKSLKEKKDEFVCPDDILEKFEYENEMSLTGIIDKISKTYPELKKLKFSIITNALIEKEMLAKVMVNGSERTRATDSAKNFGIYNRQKTSTYGRPYLAVCYNQLGQKNVLNLLKILFSVSK